MARGPKKPRWYTKKRSKKPKHNWSNDGGGKKRMLDVGRVKYFRFDLQDILADTDDQDNRSVIRANIAAKARRNGIQDAKEYIDTLGDDLEPKLADDLKKLLDRYSTYR